MFAIIILFICLLLFCVFMLYRNESVYKERMKIINRISMDADWVSKLKEFQKISYDQMIYKFWIPVKKFYKGKI